MANVSGGELVVRTLMAHGVETIFGLHGAHTDAVFQACLDHALPIIDTRHEASAGHAAEGYARISGKTGIALVTAGGGFTNAVTSIANAFLDRTPVLFIAGSGALRDDETNTLQAGIDQVAIAAPITKWAHRVTHPGHIPRMVSQALRIASAAPRGPVLLDLPWDVLTNQIEEAGIDIPAPIPRSVSVPTPALLDEILTLLGGAERPVIVAGSEASRDGAAHPLAALAAATRIPVFADYEGLNLLAGLPAELHGGLVQGLYGLVSEAAGPDVILLLGTRFGLNTAHGSGVLLPRTARIIQIDPDAREHGRLQPIALGISADIGPTLAALATASKATQAPAHRAGWLDRVRSVVLTRAEKIASQAAASNTVSLHPLAASRIVASHVDSATVVVADGALTYLWLSEVIAAARPGGFLCHGYLGSMGVGFGVAIGAQVAAGPRKTILVTGDGAVGYSIAEFDTAVRHNLPLVVVVMNNRSWGATLHFQKLAVGANRITNTRLENGAYHDVATAFGAAGYFVTDAAELDEALTAALAANRPCCINVAVDLDPIPPEELILIGMDPFGEQGASPTVE